MQAIKDVADIDFELTLEQAKSYIYSIDFSMIINKMVQHQGWKRKHAEKACEMYRNYLYLCKKYGDQYQLPPSEEIDEFWHNHIIDTKKYRRDCDRIFGRYFDHYPYLGIDKTTTRNDLYQFFERTKALYCSEFNEEIQPIFSNFLKLKIAVKQIIANPVQ